MKLQHQTDVEASPEDVWDFLQDTRAVVQCLPGAELVDELGDDRYQGVLRVAIGPLKMAYAGDVAVVERDAGSRQIVLDATGRDKRGSGAVQAHVQLQVSPIDQGARIDVISDLDLTGRIASLGRGVRDVSNRMFVQFAGALGDRVENPDSTSAPGAAAQGNGARTTGGPTASSASATTTGSGFQSGGGSAQPMREVGARSDSAGEIKLLPLVWSVTRERFADFLERLSARVRPR